MFGEYGPRVLNLLSLTYEHIISRGKIACGEEMNLFATMFQKKVLCLKSRMQMIDNKG